MGVVPAARGRVAALVGTVVLSLSATVIAQTSTGEISGRVVDRRHGDPVPGVTVLAAGPQGEQSTLTSAAGAYSLSELPVGNYTVRFLYRSRVQLEQPDVAVVAAQNVRVNASIAVDAAPEEVHVVKRRAPAIDVGSSRTGATIDQDFVRSVPAGATFGDLLEKAPGAALDASGGVSFAGATGLENGYLLDGMNVGGIMAGDLGTNLSSEFVRQIEIVSGGADAELGRAMGGTANVITKSGSNQVRGSVFGFYAPPWMAASSPAIGHRGEALLGIERPDHSGSFGAEAGGPVIRDRLFFWGGIASSVSRTHVDRIVSRMVDRDGDGQQDWDAAARRYATETVATEQVGQRTRELQYGLKLDFVPAVDNRLTVSLFGTPSESIRLETVNGDPAALLGRHTQDSTDISVRWLSRLFDRALTLEATAGLHRETSHVGPQNAERGGLNAVYLFSSDLGTIARNDVESSGCAPQAGALAPRCPVSGYMIGGYGGIIDSTANRWSGQLKGTFQLHAAGEHRVKLGAGYQLDELQRTQRFTGPDGGRGGVIVFPDGTTGVTTFFSLLPDEHGYELTNGSDDVRKLTDAAHYRDALVSKPRSGMLNGFLQDSYTPIAGVTLNLGLRWEWQQLFDNAGRTVIDLRDNLAPRLGLVVDPLRDGRSKLFAHFGRFYEALPMNLAARQFSGEGVVTRYLSPDDAQRLCSNRPDSPNGGWRTCNDANLASSSWSVASTGESAAVQPKLQGQHQDEIVIGAQHEVIADLVLGVSYTHRALRAVIEDASADGGTYVIANPGQVPDDVVRAAEEEAARKAGTPEGQQAAEVARSLAVIQSMPRPQRTYDGVTVSAVKRLSRGLMVQSSYTYSRTVGNYTGLYDGDFYSRSPNVTGQYDVPANVLNRYGRLPTDRPHIIRIDGYYQLRLSDDTTATFGVGFRGMSGQPSNYLDYDPRNPVFLLPRGSGPRAPFITQLDVKLGVRHRLTSNMWVDVFVDLFNVLDQRRATALDQIYTYDLTNPVVGGTPNDLKYAANVYGSGVTRNPNFGAPISYQPPLSGRLGMRLSF